MCPGFDTLICEVNPFEPCDYCTGGRNCDDIAYATELRLLEADAT
jgi:hypothetical protein